MDNVTQIFALISPFLAAWLTYYFGVRNKTVDIDLERKRELNIILADLLDIWYYLQRLRKVIELQKKDELPLPIPRNAIYKLLKQSNTLNEECFGNLEKSLKNIKKYDALIYYELTGLGNNLDYLRKTLIIPFVNSSGDINLGNKAKYMTKNWK